jgi:CheY-like chemotaxis protein
MQDVLQQLSHDIRSAMSDVIGGLRLVEMNRLDPQTQTQMLRVRAAADTLAALVDDALMTAAGETLVTAADDDLILADWLDALSSRWIGRAEERGSRFSVFPLGDLPRRLSVAPLVLDRIVGNLVGNALIHVPGGDVDLDVLADRETGLTIRIRDNGPGFPEEVLRTEAVGAAPVAMGATAGSGLGLRIARGLSAEIGAGLTLTNDEATGSGVAILRIPTCAMDWSGDGKRTFTPPDLSGLRILVAEDNLTNQAILRQMLDRMQADTVFVVDGFAALEALRRERFDIGLIDIEMPRKSGLEVMEEIRGGDLPLASIPLVAITAYVLRDNREAIYAAGADGIIGKPISSGEDFGRTILRYVGKPDTSDQMPAAATTPAADDATGVKFDRARFDRLMREAGASGPELLDRLVEDLKAVRSSLDAGVSATTIPEIRAQTHILIAISGAVGADRLCRRAETLNIAAKRGRSVGLAQVYQPVRDDLDDLLGFIDRHRKVRA